MKCGKSLETEGSGSQLIEKLLNQQYDSYIGFQNLQTSYDYVQTMINPRIYKGMITLADVVSEVKLHVSGGSDTENGDELAQDTVENRPRFLSPKFVEEGEKFYKKWDMNQVDPDPVLNENKKSVIASFEHLNQEKDEYWCKEAFTIAKRISKLY